MKTYEELTNAVLGGTTVENRPKEEDTKVKPLCRFYFQNQRCNYGSSCRFSHEAPHEDMTRQEILSMIPCPYFQRGACSFGNDCELLHEEKRHADNKNCSSSEHENKVEKEEEEELIDTTCGICLENVYDTQQKQFGLLSCCDHIFCHKCLMEWRCRSSPETSSSLRRVCPTCREPSNYVVPSKILPTNPNEKSTIVQRYKKRCSKIPCRKFVKGKLGSCPFGRDCFYAHHNENGRDMKGRDKTMQELFEERERHRNRRRRNNNRDMGLDMIAETLMMMALQREMNGGGGPRGQRRRHGDDDDDDEERFGVDDLLYQLLSMTENSDDELGLPLPLQFLSAMGAFDGPFNRDSDDDSSLDSMPALEPRQGSDDSDDNSMPPLEDIARDDSDDNSMPPLEDIARDDSDDNSMPPLEDIE